MDAEVHVANLAEIQSIAAKAAYVHLLIAAERAGLRSSCKSGHVRAVRLHDRQDRYVFAWSANRGHLLFYLRHPAIQAQPELPAQAAGEQLFAGRTNENPGGETTIRIETIEEARKLSDWLFSAWAAC